MPLSSYRKLEVWDVGIRMVEAVYELTAGLPPEERYGLRAQLQRAAVSVPANLAEGYGRGTRADYRHHLMIARGSLFELETHLTITARLKLVSRAAAMQAWKLIQRVGQMLTRPLASLQPETRGPKPGTRRSSHLS